MNKKIAGMTFAVLPVLFMLFGSGCDDYYRNTTTIEIGALIPVTGDAASNGAPMLAALQIAEEQINKTLENKHSRKRIKLVYADTESDAEKVDVLLKTLLGQGIRFIIGPVTSEELLAGQTTINNSNALLISPSSTLSALAVENDNIYRFVSDDSNMVKAIVGALEHEGISNLALLYRSDAWGAALAREVMDAFEAGGGTVIGSDSYSSLRQSAIQTTLHDLSALISDAAVSADTSTIGFQLICLDEGDGIMTDAAADPVLEGIRWFGSDGFVRTNIAEAGETAARFALKTGYTAPIFGVELTEAGETLQTQIEAEVASSINIYPLISYDAFMIAANTLLAVEDNASLSDLREQFLTEVAAYEGAVGPLTLNAAGDLKDGDYYFWSFISQNDEYAWQHTLTYSDGNIY